MMSKMHLEINEWFSFSVKYFIHNWRSISAFWSILNKTIPFILFSSWQVKAMCVLPMNHSVKWTTLRMSIPTGRSTWRRAHLALCHLLPPQRTSWENERAKTSSNPSWWRSSGVVSNPVKLSGSSWIRRQLTPLSRCSQTSLMPLNWILVLWKDSILWRANK